MRNALVLLIVGLLPWDMAGASPPDVNGMVSVGTTAAGPRPRVGFVADDGGHIIARINTPNKTLLFVRAGDGSEYTAQMVAYDTVSALALLKVGEGAENLKPYTFARNPAEIQRKVFSIEAQEDPAQNRAVAGALAILQQPESGAAPGYYLHTALVSEYSMGGPLFNNCSEVVGVIVPQPGFIARLLRPQKNTAYAVPVEWLTTRFSTSGMRPTRATDACLSEVAQLEEQARQAATTAAAAQSDLDAARRQLEEAQSASEEERRRLEEELAARQQAVEEARAGESAVLDALQATQHAAREREEQYTMWGGAGAAALLLLLLSVWAWKQRAVKRERREKAAAQSRAQEAQAGLAAREEDDARIRGTPAVFFEGVDSAGQTVALRVPGASIAATDGAVVGRNPAVSDFVINDPKVSRQQFCLFTDGRLLMIEDLGSTNGTTVDGKKLGAGEETILPDLSSVEISGLKLSVRLERG